MNRLLLQVGTLALLVQLTGCGPEAAPPADNSTQPSEVQEYEARRAAEREKKVTPKAPKAAPVNGPH